MLHTTRAQPLAHTTPRPVPSRSPHADGSDCLLLERSYGEAARQDRCSPPLCPAFAPRRPSRPLFCAGAFVICCKISPIASPASVPTASPSTGPMVRQHRCPVRPRVALLMTHPVPMIILPPRKPDDPCNQGGSGSNQARGSQSKLDLGNNSQLSEANAADEQQPIVRS